MLGKHVIRFYEASVRLLTCWVISETRYSSFEEELVDAEHPYKKAGLQEVHNVDIKYRQLNLAL